MNVLLKTVLIRYLPRLLPCKSGALGRPAAPVAALMMLLLFAPGAELAGQQTHSPYVGDQDREIKTLSAEEVRGLRLGEGMGLALTAELNGWPGPLHVLELADSLNLSDAQRAAVAEIFSGMRAEARRVGELIIQREGELEALFHQEDLEPTRVAELSAAIGTLRGELRAVHLAAHLALGPVLTQHQRHRYQMLRGYHDSGAGHGAGEGHEGHQGHHR